MKYLLIIIFIFSSNPSWASWFCKEAASEAQGNTFFSCGVAESLTLYQARKQALNNAKEEFKSFCNESPNCRNREFIVKPMRTDCERNGDKFICYRSLEYKILDIEKKVENYDLDDIKSEIRRKQSKLRELEDKFLNLQHLNQLNNNIEELKEVDELDVELDKLNDIKEILSRPLPNKGGFQLFYTNIPLSSGGQPVIGIGPEYERLIFSDIVGVKVNLNYVMSTKTKPDINDRGTPNSTSNPNYHSLKGVDVNFSVPIHFKNVSIAPKFGHMSVKYKSTTKAYNNFGVAQNAQTEPKNFDDNYLGLNVRYENMYFIDIEPRKYLKARETELKIGVGINISF
jgi:TolA-binding protein